MNMTDERWKPRLPQINSWVRCNGMTLQVVSVSIASTYRWWRGQCADNQLFYTFDDADEWEYLDRKS